MDIANSVLQTSPLGQNWLEIFHSTSLWPSTLITYQNPTTSSPTTRRLLPASHIRDGFRVFRIQLPSPAPFPSSSSSPSPAEDPEDPAAAPRFRFRLRPPPEQHPRGAAPPAAPAAAAAHEIPARLVPPSRGARVVVEQHEPRRVGDPDVAECLRAHRPEDRFIELALRAATPAAAAAAAAPPVVLALGGRERESAADLWRRAEELRKAAAEGGAPRGIAVGGADADADADAAGWRLVDVARVCGGGLRGGEGDGCVVKSEGGNEGVGKDLDEWFGRFEAPYGAVCLVVQSKKDRVVADGLADTGRMDENGACGGGEGDPFVLLPLPGRYTVTRGAVQYFGPSELDKRLHGT